MRLKYVVQVQVSLGWVTFSKHAVEEDAVKEAALSGKHGRVIIDNAAPWEVNGPNEVVQVRCVPYVVVRLEEGGAA